MLNIYIDVNEQIAKTREEKIVIANCKNYLNAVFRFSSDWDGLCKTAIFTRNGVTKYVLLSDDQCVIPWEVIKQGGFICAVVGMRNGTVISSNTIEADVETKPFPVLLYEGGYVAGETINPPTMDIYEQVIDRLITATDRVNEAISEGIKTISIDEQHHLIVITKANIRYDLGNVKGDKGDKFVYDDFTQEQLELLKGDKGDPFTYNNLTEAQIEELAAEIAVDVLLANLDLTEYATKKYVQENGGKIDAVKVNGEVIPIIDKNVNIQIPEPDLSLYTTKVYVDEQIGNVNLILSTINGEVI